MVKQMDCELTYCKLFFKADDIENPEIHVISLDNTNKMTKLSKNKAN